MDQSWEEIPGQFQKEAWELGLIDATWRCSQFCKQKMTGEFNSSMKRAHIWKKDHWREKVQRWQ